jgi:hypothetical protein
MDTSYCSRSSSINTSASLITFTSSISLGYFVERHLTPAFGGIREIYLELNF